MKLGEQSDLMVASPGSRRRLGNQDLELGGHPAHEHQPWPWTAFTGSLVNIESALLYPRLVKS